MTITDAVRELPHFDPANPEILGSLQAITVELADPRNGFRTPA